jgi:hypothetical protein
MNIDENTEIEIILTGNFKKKRKNTWFLNFKKELYNSWTKRNVKGNYTIECFDLTDDSFWIEVFRLNGSSYLKMTIFYTDKKINVEKTNMDFPMVFKFKNLQNMKSVCYNFICFD